MDTRPGRRGSPRRAVSRTGPEPGARVPILPESFRSARLLSVSPLAPRQGRSPGGSPLGGSKILRSRLSRRRDTGAEARFRLSGIPRPKPRVPPGGPSAEALWTAASQLPGRSPVLPDRVGAEAPPRPVAVRGPKSRCCRADCGPKPGTCLIGSRPGAGKPMGALRNLPLSHPLKGKPAASAWRRLRQPPGPFAGETPPGGTAPASLGLWPGLRTVAGLPPRPRMEAVMESESHQAQSACG